MKSLFEQNGGTYSIVNGYRLPDLTLPVEKHYDICRFGLMQRHYLQNHLKGLFTTLLKSGKLNKHLAETDQIANDRLAYHQSNVESLRCDRGIKDS